MDAVRAKYLLNDISQHFYVPLRMVEVALRNRINAAICESFPATWYDTLPYSQGGRESVAAAKAGAARDVVNRALVPDDVVCRLTFGFWVNMLDPHYRNAATKSRFIWNQHRFRTAFPGSGPGLTAARVMDRLRQLKDLRNRLFHHEPIWKSKHVNSLPDAVRVLRAKYEEVCEVLGWLSPEQHALINAWGFPGRFQLACNLERFDRHLW